MRIDSWLKTASAKLSNAGIATARLDSLVLLEDLLNTNRTHLLAHPETRLSASQIKLLSSQLKLRASHQPLAYIRGKTEFYGRKFLVSPDVLEPRPESETMIDLLKQFFANGMVPDNCKIADVGTGSGALGITAKLELKGSSNCKVDLIDIDKKALDIAKKNVVLHTISASIVCSDLMTDSSKDYDVLLCNLPYVPDDFIINQAAKSEPRIAIFGGADGLDLYRKLFAQINNFQSKPLLILSESLPTQHTELAKIAFSAEYKLSRTDDFIQQFELKKK